MVQGPVLHMGSVFTVSVRPRSPDPLADARKQFDHHAQQNGVVFGEITLATAPSWDGGLDATATVIALDEGFL